MPYDWIKLCIKNMKGSAIENHVSGFFIKSLTFFQNIDSKICWGFLYCVPLLGLDNGFVFGYLLPKKLCKNKIIEVS